MRRVAWAVLNVCLDNYLYLYICAQADDDEIALDCMSSEGPLNGESRTLARRSALGSSLRNKSHLFRVLPRTFLWRLYGPLPGSHQCLNSIRDHRHGHLYPSVSGNEHKH